MFGTHRGWVQAASALVLLFSQLGSTALAESTDAFIRQIHEQALSEDGFEVAGEPILARGVLPLFYEDRDYQPAWTDLEYANSVIELIERSEDDGLRKEDYHYLAVTDLLDRLSRGPGNRSYLLAQLDVLLTDGLILLAHHLSRGKVNASDLISTWNYDRRSLLPEAEVSALNRHIAEQTVEEGLASLRPSMPAYAALRQALKKFTRLAEREDFTPIPSGTTLREGDSGDAVALLRSRLVDLGYLEATGDSDVYDEALVEAVRSIQLRFNIDSDGIAGAQTLKELNVPFSERADQIRINLERIRWVANDASSYFIVVNIGGFDLRVVRDNELIWTTDVMVGKVNTKTPVFKAKMSYLVLNPTWTVPRSISHRSLLRKMQADPGYVEAHNYRLVDREGQTADPDTLDWASFSRRNFPYTVVQQPGPGNALGRVKFIFPNPHSVYLHDTPSRDLFSRTRRAFSHGCIRVKDPLELARILLDDSETWSADKISNVIEGGQLQNVTLPRKVDVLLMYWTVKVGADERIGFTPDIYGRDPDLLEQFSRPLF